MYKDLSHDREYKMSIEDAYERLIERSQEVADKKIRRDIVVTYGGLRVKAKVINIGPNGIEYELTDYDKRRITVNQQSILKYEYEYYKIDRFILTDYKQVEIMPKRQPKQ